MKAAVILKPTKQHAFIKGHPWIFPKAIQSIQSCETGELVQILDAEKNHIATGMYNEHSMYRVRILAYAYDQLNHYSLSSILDYRLSQALQLRQQLLLPNPHTTAYRLLNSEGDGLSGLTIDRFNQTCVISSSAYWVEQHKTTIQACIKKILPTDEILWVPQIKALNQDGWTTAEPMQYAKTEEIFEAGVIFNIDFSNTQKTGLFLDQRENHHRIAQLAKNKRVLDLYCYTGGFALHAARAEAKSITAVDSSAAAIDRAQKNAQLNHIDTIQWIEDDARNHLNRCGEYDLIILDPPKLVPSKKHMEKAKNYYRFLHREVFKSMKKGSLLMTCNCSSAMSAAEFSELVSMQASIVGKTVRTLGVFGPAMCHPTLQGFPEGHYLTAVLVAVL